MRAPQLDGSVVTRLVCKRPEQQTNEEWLRDYDAGSSVASSSEEPSLLGIRRRLRYVGHRTTCMGAVALEFEILDDVGTASAVRFFNVSLRGPRGKNYPAGSGGQFFPNEKGKFRRFWMEAVGSPPLRWSTVHKSLRNKLHRLRFVGRVTTERDGKGNSYYKIHEIELER